MGAILSSRAAAVKPRRARACHQRFTFVVKASHMIDLPPPSPSIEINLATQGMSKGLRQTEGPQILVRGEVGLGPVFVGAFFKSITSPTASGEAAVLTGLRGAVGGFDLSGSVAYKWNTDRQGQPDGDTFEFVATASRRVGPVTPRVSVTYSPDDLGGTRESLYVEAGAGITVLPRLTASAAIGRRERDGGNDYTTFNVGVNYSLVRWLSADLRYYDTGQSDFGETYRPRVVAALRARF
jgi:hypothetical protein